MRRLNAISGSRQSADSSAPPSTRRRFPLLGFARDRAGVSAIEFAMVAPVLILLIVETLQIGLYFYSSASLNRATNYALRQIRIGAVANGNMTAAQFQNLLCAQLPTTMSCPTNLIVNVYDVTEGIGSGQGFNTFLNASQTGIAQPSPMASATFCPGSTGSTIYIQVYYALPLFSPIWLAFAMQNQQQWNGNYVHFVGASAAVKNEPYLGGQDPVASC